LGRWLGDGSSGYGTGQLERRLHAHPLAFGFRSVRYHRIYSEATYRQGRWRISV